MLSWSDHKVAASCGHSHRSVPVLQWQRRGDPAHVLILLLLVKRGWACLGIRNGAGPIRGASASRAVVRTHVGAVARQHASKHSLQCPATVACDTLES